ncbi:hypothetical protein OOK12_27210 [Streptomyces sp. NBC_00452]|uniref:hypothetical protein n=1 Tax=Streptomyces sp. NBC_00452 TaxID=2975746 RepID=UPI002259D078|nr:hypothetical protein [Streptomyces sp. NBC_00452]MCX5060645.1 hypothetical protein [Streptomyces sp. NBC_00452]
MKRAALAAVSALSLAAALTACSGNDSDTDAKSTASPSASTSTAKKQVGPEERLARLVVTKADISRYTFKAPTKRDALAASQDEMRVDKAACTQLAYAMNELPIGEPEASLTRVAHNSTTMGTYVTLATYADGKAETAMKELSKAAASCAGGFTAKSGAGATTYTSATAEPAPSAGDQSVAAAATFQYRGAQTVRTQTFRFGDTIVNYFTIDGSAFVYGRPGSAKIPADLVKAQNTKLG